MLIYKRALVRVTHLGLVTERMAELLSRHHLRLESLHRVLNHHLGLLLVWSDHLSHLFVLSLVDNLRLSHLTLFYALLFMRLWAKLADFRLSVFGHWKVHLVV